jgi:ATP synthase F1 gamma subunit
MHDLEDLTNILEQTAARTISQLRKTILDSRPFFKEVWRIYAILKKLSPPSPNVVHKHLIVAIGLDWGMPGNLLNRMVAEAERVRDKHGADLLIAGKMAHGRFNKDDERTVHLFSIPREVKLNDIQPIYKIVASYAKVTIVYPKFESLSKQTIAQASFSSDDSDQLTDDDQTKSNDKNIMVNRFIIDPNPQEIVNYINEAIVGLTVYHYFSEAMLSYSAAQMISMRNGHDNAKKEVDKLQTLYYRARRELIDSKLRELYGSRAAHKVVE